MRLTTFSAPRRLAEATAVLALVATFGLTQPLAAQPQASQHGGVFQLVNTTTISLEFDRPVLRGRSVFGDILDYEAVWTPGANIATWIDFSGPVRIQGESLPAGRYGIWTIPHENRAWEWIFVRDWDAHHSFFPMESEALRVTASPQHTAHMETLAFYFPVVGPYHTILHFHWGEVVVPLRIEVDR